MRRLRHLSLAALLLSLVTAVCAQAPVTTKQLNVPIQSGTPTAPSTVSARRVGQPGNTNYYYWVVADFPIGDSSPSTVQALVANSNNTLDTNNYNAVSWSAVDGASSYDLLRTTTPTAPSGACNCAVATDIAGVTASDQSNTLQSYTVSPYSGSALFTVTNRPVAAGEYQLTFTGDHGPKFEIDNLTGAVIPSPTLSNITVTTATTTGVNEILQELSGQTGDVLEQKDSGGTVNFSLASGGKMTATSPGITPTSIEGVEYADQFNWTAVGSTTLSPGSLVSLDPSWTAIPTGMESGALSSVSESSSSAVVTRVSGDEFNPNWASGKSVVLDGVALTIVSCSSATSCTLSGDAPQTSGHGWMVVGYPTPIRISGGTGAAETFDALGAGASECPGGSALSICGTLANSHSGSWTVASATDGMQEAVNEVEQRPSAYGKGRVHVPTPTALTTADDWSTAGIACWVTYGPVVVSRAGVTLDGDGDVSSHICNAGNGAGVFEVNASSNSIRDLYVSGSSGSGPDFEWYGTLGYGDNSMERVHADGATGTFSDPLGATVANAGIYVMGSERFGLYSSTSGYNNRGVVVVENTQANGTAITSVDGDYLLNSGDGFSVGDGSFSVEGCNVLGGRIFGNGGAGIRLNCFGGTVHGVYLEGNAPSIVLSADSSGISVTGNQIEQLITSGTTMISGGSSGAAVQDLTYNDVVAGNHMVWDGTGTSTANSFIDGWFVGSQLGPNSYDWFSTTAPLTVPYGVVLENSSVASGAATNAVLASSYGPSAQFNTAGHLTITTAVDDLTLSKTSADITQDYHQAAAISGDLTASSITASTLTAAATAGNAAFLFGDATNNEQFAFLQGSNTAVLSWWPHNNIWQCAIGSPGICTFDYAAVFGVGATLPSGQTLTNNGTISGGTVSADLTNTCSGTSAAMTAGTVTISNACITGSRPIMLVEATKGGTQGILSYTQSAGSLVISSTSATDTSTVSWVQN